MSTIDLAGEPPGPGDRIVLRRARSSPVVTPRPQPIPNVPALLLPGGAHAGPKAVVVADLHLGLGATPERPSGPPEAKGERLAARLLEICAGVGARRLVVAGDIKHPIVGTPPWLRPELFTFFSELLSGGLGVTVVLGNHDVGLVPHLPREVEVAGPEGVVVGSAGIFHGHRWPSEEVLSAPTLIAGHLHPGFRFAPSPEHPDGKQRCWVRVVFPEAPARRRPSVHRIRSREMIVLPAFHPLAGTESLNRERPARGRSFLYGRFLSQGAARAYLLDGSDLGAIPTVRAVPGPTAR